MKAPPLEFPKIECLRSYLELRIKINGILHLYFLLKDFVGLQSWYEGTDHRMYFIEISLKGSEPILVEYVDRENWKRVLQLLDANM